MSIQKTDLAKLVEISIMETKQYNALFSFIWNIANDVHEHPIHDCPFLTYLHKVLRQIEELPDCIASREDFVNAVRNGDSQTTYLPNR